MLHTSHWQTIQSSCLWRLSVNGGCLFFAGRASIRKWVKNAFAFSWWRNKKVTCKNRPRCPAFPRLTSTLVIICHRSGYFLPWKCWFRQNSMMSKLMIAHRCFRIRINIYIHRFETIKPEFDPVRSIFWNFLIWDNSMFIWTIKGQIKLWYFMAG